MTPTQTPAGDIDMSGIVEGEPLAIGSGFSARSFRHAAFGGLMDPLVMLDHFTMTEPTFGAHPHAGMSAVSILFEDSEGQFNNRDSLGNDIDLLPGDLYWLKAGRGAVHDEAPRPGSRTHALQVFVNLPSRLKQDAPEALHVAAGDMPSIRNGGARVRVVLGQSNDVTGASSPALPFTILDAHFRAGSRYTHTLPAGRAAVLVPIRGQAEVVVDGAVTKLETGHAIALRNRDEARPLTIRARAEAQLALLQGMPVQERFVQQGPFVMSTIEDVDAVSKAHAAGLLGRID